MTNLHDVQGALGGLLAFVLNDVVLAHPNLHDETVLQVYPIVAAKLPKTFMAFTKIARFPTFCPH